MDLSAFADDVGDATAGGVTIGGLGTRGGPVAGIRCVRAPSGIDWVQADEMTVMCGAGTPVDDLAAVLAAVGQRTVLPAGGTVGGALAVGHSGIRRLGDGPVRDALLQARYVNAGGAVVKAGGPTVKNVSGFDVCRLLVGSQGTLGFVGEVILRTRPIAPHAQWFTRPTDDPSELFAAVHRPVSMLWDGAAAHVLLEGHPLDVAEQAARVSLVPADGPPALPPERHLVGPGDLARLRDRLTVGGFVAELGAGVVHTAAGALPTGTPDPGVVAIARRVKQQFDPHGRLNPGRSA